MSEQRVADGCWSDGALPENVSVGRGSVISGARAFKRMHSLQRPAVVIGENCTMDSVLFALGAEARLAVGNHCHFLNAVLLCELDIRIGNYVVIGWGTSVADSDFHPIDPAARIEDAIACSPVGKHLRRPPAAKRAIVIEDCVWIGAQVTILKGVHIGAGAWIEPGSLVTRDVPAGARVMGNPAQVVGQVPE